MSAIRLARPADDRHRWAVAGFRARQRVLGKRGWQRRLELSGMTAEALGAALAANLRRAQRLMTPEERRRIGRIGSAAAWTSAASQARRAKAKDEWLEQYLTARRRGDARTIVRMRAKLMARTLFQSGNKFGGTSKAKLAQAIAIETRRMLHDAGPEMASALLELARNAEDERVRSVCIVAALDRAGFRPQDKPADFSDDRPRFDPRAYSPEELARIEEALLLVVDPARARRARGEDVQEVIPPESGERADGGEG